MDPFRTGARRDRDLLINALTRKQEADLLAQSGAAIYDTASPDQQARLRGSARISGGQPPGPGSGSFGPTEFGDLLETNVRTGGAMNRSVEGAVDMGLRGGRAAPQQPMQSFRGQTGAQVTPKELEQFMRQRTGSQMTPGELAGAMGAMRNHMPSKEQFMRQRTGSQVTSEEIDRAIQDYMSTKAP